MTIDKYSDFRFESKLSKSTQIDLAKIDKAQKDLISLLNRIDNSHNIPTRILIAEIECIINLLDSAR